MAGKLDKNLVGNYSIILNLVRINYGHEFCVRLATNHHDYF